MGKKSSNQQTVFKVSVIVVLFLFMVGLVVFKTGVLESSDSFSDGLSGLVAVKGTVKAADLGLTKNEVKKINRAVDSHQAMFSQVDVFLDSKGGKGGIDQSTVLVMAMVLETNGECEVRSWSRKVPRSELVPQMILYMNKAAKEYEQFKKYPDVKQNFKCLYI